MVRVAPDSNDQLVYTLTETSSVYRNTGSYLPNDPATDLTVSGTIDRLASSPFGMPCPAFPGTHNWPAGASSTRNYIWGAEQVNIQPPISISLWVYQRNYVNNGDSQHYVKKLFRQHSSTSAFSSPFCSFEITNSLGNSGQDLYFATTSSITSQTGMTITDYPMPLYQWNHIGMTHDGSNLRAYLNGVQLIRYSGSTQLNTLATSSSIVYNDVNYTITSGTGTYDLGTTDIGNHGDEVMTQITLPFPVSVWGVTYTTCFASSNGFVEFGQNTQGFGFGLPNGSLGTTICVFERDENTTSPFGIFTATLGSVGNRTFVIEWRNQPFGGGSTLNYEIKFYENSNVFELFYTTSTSTSTGCIGVQSPAGGKTAVFSNSTTIPAAGTKITFTPTTSNSGALVLGATPLYLSTQSSTKEEGNFNISDLRIANVTRPASYFRDVYRLGVLPISLSNKTQYYKLRAYDLSCSPPQFVTWIDTTISLANAPAFPCTGPYSDPEVVDSWVA